MSWWDHFAEECPRLAELGITQAWLPPPNKAMAKVIRSSYDALCSLTSRRTVLVMMPMIWYADKDEIVLPAYRLNLRQWDLGEFDQKGGTATRWGMKDQLTRACSIARQHGVGPVITAVLNVRDLERSILISYPHSPTNSKSLARTGQNDSWQSESTQGIDCVRLKKRR